MTFSKWIDTYTDEAEIDLQRQFNFTEGGTFHIMPVGTVIEFLKGADKRTQAQAKTTIVKIDFAHGDPYHFFEYLAKGIARYHSPKGW